MSKNLGIDCWKLAINCQQLAVNRQPKGPSVRTLQSHKKKRKIWFLKQALPRTWTLSRCLKQKQRYSPHSSNSSRENIRNYFASNSGLICRVAFLTG